MKIDVSPKEYRRISDRRAREAMKLKAPPKVTHKRAKPDRGRERDPGFLAYLRRQPCEARHLGGCDGPIEAAHVRYGDASKGSVNPGLQRKNHDRHANPLCSAHHKWQHAGAERNFWSALGKDAYDTAAFHYGNYTKSLEKSTGLCEK